MGGHRWLGYGGVGRGRSEGHHDSYGDDQASRHRLAPVRVLAAPEEEHLPRPLVIDRLCLLIGLLLVGCMEGQEVVRHLSWLNEKRYVLRGGDPRPVNRSGWPPSQVVNVGSVRGCPLIPWRQIA